MGKKKPRLQEGAVFQCLCASCRKTWNIPAIISYLDDEGNIKISDRHTTCTKTDSNKNLFYNFSLELLFHDDSLRANEYWNIIRGCSSHRNFHYHIYRYHSGCDTRMENHPLNSIAESNAAYEEANIHIVEGAIERIEEWQASN